jgi:hypothetical protein
MYVRACMYVCMALSSLVRTLHVSLSLSLSLTHVQTDTADGGKAFLKLEYLNKSFVTVTVT